MLAVKPCADPFIRICASGRLTAAEYRRFEPAFAAELERRQMPVALLLDMRGFGGWTVGGFLRDLAVLAHRGRRRQALAPLDHRRRRAAVPRPDAILPHCRGGDRLAGDCRIGTRLGNFLLSYRRAIVLQAAG